MPIILCFIETFLLWKLYKKYGLKSSIAIIYFIVYFYCNAILFDLYIFSNQSVLVESFVKIDPHSIAFDMVFILYFLFLLSYFFFFYFSTIVERTKNNNSIKLSFKIKDNLLILLSCILLLQTLRSLQLNRDIITKTATFATQLMNVFFYLSFVFIILYTKNKYKIIRILYILIFVAYCIFQYQREPLVLLITVILFYYNKKIRLSYLIVLGVLSMFIFSYYKMFYGTITYNLGWNVFFDYIKNTPISFSSLDPIASFSLLYAYVAEKNNDIFAQYYFSYILSFYDQYNRYINGQDILSLGQYASKIFVDLKYGVAFSMILESILNFSLLGPILLAWITKTIYVFCCRKFYHVIYLIDSMFVLFFMSFVRSELMVMIKIYIIPMCIFLFALSHLLNKRIIKIH